MPRAVAVLVVASPCPLILAATVALGSPGAHPAHRRDLGARERRGVGPVPRPWTGCSAGRPDRHHEQGARPDRLPDRPSRPAHRGHRRPGSPTKPMSPISAAPCTACTRSSGCTRRRRTRRTCRSTTTRKL